MLLGDKIKEILESIGITQERVSHWIGECCCEERKERLNQLHIIAKRVINGKIETSKAYLVKLLNGE